MYSAVADKSVGLGGLLLNMVAIVKNALCSAVADKSRFDGSHHKRMIHM